MKNNAVLAIAGGLGKVGVSIANELKTMFGKFVFIDSGKVTDQQIDFFETTFGINKYIIEIADICDTPSIAKLLEKHEVDVCVGAVPSFLQYKVSEATAVYGQCHFFDLGASHECLNKQKELSGTFRQNKKILMPFCGFDPGMLNILLLSCVKHVSCDEIKIYVGGIAEKKPGNRFIHYWTFNPESTLETYRGNVYAVQDGKLVTRTALDGFLETNISLQCFESFFTNCGNEEVMRTVSQAVNIKKCEIRTIRHLGHWKELLFLKESGFLEDDLFPITVRALTKSVPFAEKDVTFLEMRLFRGDRKIGFIEWAEHGELKTITAMQRTTAKSAAITIKLALEHVSHTPFAGFIMPETFTNNVLNFHPKRILEEMQGAGLSIKMSLP